MIELERLLERQHTADTFDDNCRVTGQLHKLGFEGAEAGGRHGDPITFLPAIRTGHITGQLERGIAASRNRAQDTGCISVAGRSGRCAQVGPAHSRGGRGRHALEAIHYQAAVFSDLDPLDAASTAVFAVLLFSAEGDSYPGSWIGSAYGASRIANLQSTAHAHSGRFDIDWNLRRLVR